MPIDRKYFKTLGVFHLHSAEQSKRQSKSQHHQPDDDVRSVQPHQRVESSTEQICVNGQTVLIDELIPFPGRAGKKNAAQQDRGGQPERTHAHFVPPQRTGCQPDRQTARQKANRANDREFRHILWRWSAEAFSKIKEIGNDKNDKDSRLCDDQANDAHHTAGW